MLAALMEKYNSNKKNIPEIQEKLSKRPKNSSDL